MTGEITLSGLVFPIGGVKEKVLAAHRAGIRRIILPSRNEADVDEIPEDVKNELQIVFVSGIAEVLDAALEVLVANPPPTASSGVRATSGRGHQPEPRTTHRKRLTADHRGKQITLTHLRDLLRWSFCLLRQRFDIEEELERACLLHSQQELQVNACSRSQWCRQRYRSRTQSAIKRSTKTLNGRLLERCAKHRHRTRRRIRRTCCGTRC